MSFTSTFAEFLFDLINMRKGLQNITAILVLNHFKLKLNTILIFAYIIYDVTFEKCGCHATIPGCQNRRWLLVLTHYLFKQIVKITFKGLYIRNTWQQKI